MFSLLPKHYSKEELIEILNKPLEDSYFFPNHKNCRFLNNDGLCLAYEERGFSCRAGGNSCLDEVYQNNCFRKDLHREKSPFTPSEYWNMMIKLEKIDDILRKTKSTLYISRLSLESWLSLYLSADIKNRELSLIHNILSKHLHLSFLQGKYTDHVNFVKKVNKVIKGQKKLSQNSYSKALILFKEIIDEDFDGYFLDEAFYYSGICLQKMGKELEAMLAFNRVSKFHPYYESATIQLNSLLQSSQILSASAM